MPEPQAMSPTRRHRPRGLTAALGMVASLLGACATSGSETRDEGAERIDAIIRPGQAPEPIPDGIALGPDAPPLSGTRVDEPLAQLPTRPAPEARTLAEEARPVFPFAWGAPMAPAPCAPPPHGALLPAPVPLACLLHPGSIRYRLEPRPGGSIPGLLP